tara:strand:- start:802 stop:1410 length:609 start_codon:yes stop_codon:yes gene_type:complete
VAITNGYCTLAEMKTALQLTDNNDDTSLEVAVAAASRMIDDYTGRFFYQSGTSPTPAIRYYTPQDAWTLATDDIVSISEIASDDNFNRTYGTIWASDDYMVEPVNNPARGWPVSRVLAVGAYIFPFSLPQSVRIKGIFGFSAVPPEINIATQLQASRLFVRRQSPFGIAGSAELGTVRLAAKLDADVEALLRPFRKNNGLAK